ncbi:hypothetical protein niasHS_004438 [Heterodera schachtii]|uniref:BTB domain-containing protein n=1 Tax=Heterodera schachtii TaxID=97005 RepID=A0ABD2JR35_HETSC
MSKSAIAGLKSILSTGEHADVHFLVGDGDAKKRVPAHKFILKNASDVFAAMFRFDSQNANAENDSANGPTDVEIPDVEAAAFKVMLSFIYMDDLSGLNGDNAMAVLCAAKKYNIPGLVDPSLQIPISELRNVFVAYAYACLFDLKDFANCCLSYIDKNADILIKSEEFLQIDQKTLCEIFGRDELQIHEEITIWKAALRWADEQCRQNEIECSADNRGKMLDKVLPNIRFPLIPKEDFTKSVVPTGVLTIEEVDSIYQNYSHPNLSDAPGLFPLKFPTHRRNKSEDIIEMEIEKVSEFAVEEVGSERLSDAVQIGGFSWKILAEIKTKNESNEKWLGFLLCYDPKKENLSCKSSATLRIVSQKNGKEDLIGRFNDHIFKDLNGFGFPNSISFAELLDPSKGFYNKDEDKVKLAIDVIVDEPKTEKFVSDPNKSNGTLSMEIEKVSEFAREFILSQRKSETLYIKGMPWKILAKIETKNESTEKWLGFYLSCDSSEKDGNRSRKCSATLRIVSQKSDVGDFKREFSEKWVFNNEIWNFGFPKLISFAELMDPSKGLYNKDEDKITLAIDLKCE